MSVVIHGGSVLVAQCDLPNLGEKQPDFSCEKDAQIVKNIVIWFQTIFKFNCVSQHFSLDR